MKRPRFIVCAAAVLLCSCGTETPESSEADTVPAFAAQTVTETESPATETTAPAASRSAAEINALAAGAELLPEEIGTDDLWELFTQSPISDDVFSRINGVSYQENPYISPDDLRYLRVLHYDPDGAIRTGEMICNASIASDLIAIFHDLYEAAYPIERMVLIDEYGGDDEASMAANNTSCFNYRVVAGSTTLSYHAQGLAVDINPRNNPYVTYGADGSEHISPENGKAYANREMFFPMKIDEDDLCFRLFTEHGFEWGGSWTSQKDYQHFEKP